jgi:hypothetical protein
MQLAMSETTLEHHSLDTNLKEFKKYNANRKFKAAARVIIAVNKMSHALGAPKGDASKKANEISAASAL